MSRRFEDLIVWQKARALASELVQVIRARAFEREFRLTDQLLRAARSVPADIAEGFERNARREFHRFAGIAKGSAGETRAHLYTAFDAGLLDAPTFEKLRKQCEEVSRLPAGLRKTLKTPAKPPARHP